MSANDLTPRQLVWGAFYRCLHEEVQRLEKLAQKKTTTDESAKTQSVVANQRQPKASVTKNDSSHSR